MMSDQSPLTRITCALAAVFLLITTITDIHNSQVSSTKISTTIDSNDDGKDTKPKKIAIIGGGIGGTFTSKYLTDYDTRCHLQSITVFSPPPSTNDNNINSNARAQKSRVASLTLDDGTVVELGASILHGANRYATEMMTNPHTTDPSTNLMKVEPFSAGSKKKPPSAQDGTPKKLRDGLGVYDNNANGITSPWALLITNQTSAETKSAMIWRYNLDLYRVNSATESALEAFGKVYESLESLHPDSFLESPDSIWEGVGLGHVAHTSLEEYLDGIWVDKGGTGGVAWWRRLLLGWWGVEQGVLREEMYEAMNMVNNGKNNRQMTALAGLVNFAASTGPLFAIDGGNDQLMPHAIRQASSQRNRSCKGSSSTTKTDTPIIQIPQKIQTILSKPDKQGMDLYLSDGTLVGTYDTVILAAPLQFCGINFLVQGSLFDSEVLSPMPLNGLVDGDTEDANEHGHRVAIGGGEGHLPDSAKRRYTEVFTTVISGGILNASYFDLDHTTSNDDEDEEEDGLPRSIIFTERGRERLGFTSISQITPDTGVYKMFSPSRLTDMHVEIAFGSSATVEHVEVWAGERGGATPDFNGGVGTSSTSTQFLLYDGDHGLGGGGGDDRVEDGGGDRGAAPALYYVNAMEASVSAIEISAIGAKAVSKLVARRLGIITPEIVDEKGEDL